MQNWLTSAILWRIRPMAGLDWEKGVHSTTFVGENVVGLQGGFCYFLAISFDRIKNGLGTKIINFSPANFKKNISIISTIIVILIP